MTKRVPYYLLKNDVQVVLAIVRHEIPAIAQDMLDTWPTHYHKLLRMCQACWEAEATQRPTMRRITQYIHLLDSYMESDRGTGVMSKSLSLRVSKPKEESNVETVCVDEYEWLLETCDAFLRELQNDVYVWLQTVNVSQQHLQEWTKYFGNVIGITEDHPSEAFDAFREIADQSLSSLCYQLEECIRIEIFAAIAQLMDSMKAPFKLLKTMHELEPLYLSSLHQNRKKRHLSSDMVDSSKGYITIRGRLATELPTYLSLLDKGVVACICHLAHRQTEFWEAVRQQWNILWECLRIDGETNAGCEETVRNWRTRYSDVEKSLCDLHILRPDSSFLSHNFLRPLDISPSTKSKMPSFPGKIRRFPNSSDATRNCSPASPASSDNPSRRQPRRILPTQASLSSLLSSYRGKSRSSTPDDQRAGSKASSLNNSSTSLNSSSSSHQPHHREHTRMVGSHSTHTHKPRKPGSSIASHQSSEALPQKSITSSSALIPIPKDELPSSHSSAGARAQVELVPKKSHLLYYTRVVYACSPPRNLTYMNLPFFKLEVGDILGVLRELKHPDQCQGLPLEVDSANDCLLVVKNERGDVGLALASFLVPLDSTIDSIS